MTKQTAFYLGGFLSDRLLVLLCPIDNGNLMTGLSPFAWPLVKLDCDYLR